MNRVSRRRFLNGGFRMLGVGSAAAAFGPLGVLVPGRSVLAAGAGTITATSLTPKEMGGLTLLQGAGVTSWLCRGRTAHC